MLSACGWEEYRYIGPSDYAGPKLFPVSGKVKKPGVYELPMNTTLREVIFKYAGGTLNNRKVKAVFSGALDCFTSEELDMPMDYSPFGFGGTGTVIFVNRYIQPTSICGLGAVAGRLIKQAMQKFPQEFERYRKRLAQAG